MRATAAGAARCTTSLRGRPMTARRLRAGGGRRPRVQGGSMRHGGAAEQGPCSRAAAHRTQVDDGGAGPRPAAVGDDDAVPGPAAAGDGGALVLMDKTRIHIRSGSVGTYTFFTTGFPRFLSIHGARGLLALNKAVI
jgi:hypothetical protein